MEELTIGAKINAAQAKGRRSDFRIESVKGAEIGTFKGFGFAVV
jgi:hypothetical protein